MFRILLALIVGGGVVAFMGIKELRLASHCKNTSQKITAEALEKSGVGDNANVELTDFVLLTGSFVYQSEKNKPDQWKMIWIPAVGKEEYINHIVAEKTKHPEAKTDDLPPPKNIRILVKAKDIENEAQLEGFDKEQTITGLIVSDFESIGSKEKEILSSSYPDMNVDKCYILEVGRKPMSYPLGLGMSAGGIVMVALGGVGMLKNFKR